MKSCFLFLLTLLSLVSCIVDKGDIAINIKRKAPTGSSPSAITSASISSVQVINNQLVINGTGLSDVSSVIVNGNSLNENFSIETKTATKIIANSVNAFSFDISKLFNLILSDANASATFAIDFSLCNATLNGKGFSCAITALDKDVLSFDQATNKWKPRSINGLSYQGAWDATDPLPATTSPGDYFIVSVASAPYGVGDWIVWNGGSYDQINNSTTITSVFGRTGAVVATEGDYNLNKLLDVDLTVAPTAGKILKYDGTKWIAADDLSGGGAGSVTSAEIANNAVTDAKIDSVSASKITGTLTSAQIADGTIVNADINAAAAIDYSKLNIPNTAIPYAKLNIADGDIPAAKISGLPAATSVLATTIVDADTTHAPDGNAVFDALALKLNTTGGTLTIGTISGVPTPTNSDDVANKGYTDTRDALKLAKAGDTMSGVLTLDNDLKIKGGSNYVTVKGHATSATYNLVLPNNGGTNGYVLATDGSGNTSWIDVTTAVASLDTDDVAEGSRLYFTKPRVLATDLAGLNTGVVGPIVAADTVLGAMGKLQYQMTDLKGKGQWDKNVNDISYGAGNVEINTKLRLKDSGSNFVELKAPATVTTTYTLTFPANDGNANQILRTDEAGVLTWVDLTDASVQAFARAVLPTCAAGEVLKSNGTSFSCVTDNAGAGAFSSTASKAVVTSAGGTLDVSATTSTEIGYVSGVTSSIQTQLNNKEVSITAGTALQYLNGLKNFVTLDTLAVPENTRLYFTEPRVLATDLSGFVASNTAITAADSVLSGLEKSQGQITNLNSIKPNIAGDTFTGDVTFNTQVRLKDGAAAAHITLKAPATGTTSHTLTLPGTVGTSGQVLSMTGTAGVLEWTTPSGTAGPSGAAGGDLSGTYPNPTITGLDATKIATGVVDNTEFNYLNGVTSAIQTQLNAKQTSDATLTALAGFNTNGIMVQTAADTFVGRSIAGTANRVAVTNGDGVAGNPTVNISTTLLPSPVVGDVGKFLKATAADTSVWTALGSSDVTTALGFTPINKAGDSLTAGTFTFSGAALLRALDPVGPTDVANKQYVDSFGQWIKTGSDLYYSAGNVGVGTATPGVPLDVNGSARATKLLSGNGAFNAPSITFSNYPTTGFSSDGNLKFSVSGGLQMTLSTTALDFNAGGAGPKIQQTGGNAALPSYAFNSDPDTGMFNPNSSGGSNELGFSTSGVERIRIDPTGKVGIGSTTPQSKLDVNGAIRVGVDATACSAAISGAMRFNTPNVEFCNGTTWAAFGTSGAAVASSQITDGTIVDVDINAAANITATKLGTGAVDNTELNYLDGVTSAIQTQLNGKQTSDATLTALAGFNTNGIMVQTTADTFVGRSIAGTGNRVAVTNGDGVAGNPTVNISTTLLPSPVVGDVGKFLKATAADTSVWTALGSSDITTALGFTPINKAGDSLTTGTITLSGAAVLRSPDPIGLTDVANKQYVDSYGQWTKSGSDLYHATGQVSIGTNSPTAKLTVSSNSATLPAASAGTVAHFANADATSTRLLVDTYGGGSANTSNVTMRSSGGTAASPAALASGDVLGQLSFAGYGTSYSNSKAAIRATASETWGASALGTYMSFYTTPTGSTATPERMRIDSNGSVGIGTTTPQSALDVYGTGSGTAVATTGATDPTTNLRVGRGAVGINIGTIDNGTGYIQNRNLSDNSINSLLALNPNGGNVGIGTTAPTSKLDMNTADNDNLLTIQNTDATAIRTAGMKIISYGGTGFQSPSVLQFYNSRGAKASQAPSQLNDILGRFTTYGRGATGFGVSALIDFGAAENFTDSAYGGNIRFSTTSIGSTVAAERMRIDSSGNVGIGTTAPTTSLSFGGNNSQVIGMEKHTVANSAGNGMTLKAGGATSGATDKAGGYLHLNGGISTGLGTSIIDFSTASPGVTGTANNNPTVKMTILGNGNVGVGTTAPIAKLQINGTTSTAGFEGVAMSIQDTQTIDGGWARGFGIGMNNKNFARIGVLGGRTAGVDSLSYLYFSVDENTVSPWVNNSMVIKANGFVGIGTIAPDDKFVVNNGTTTGRYTASGWTHSSDARLKHDINTLENSTDKILQLRGVDYILNSDPKNERQIGFIAQEVETIFPEVVKTDKAGYKSMVYANLIAPLVEAFKDLYKKITDIFVTTEKNSRAIASVNLKVKKLEEENAAKTKEIAELKAYLCVKDPGASICK